MSLLHTIRLARPLFIRLRVNLISQYRSKISSSAIAATSSRTNDIIFSAQLRSQVGLTSHSGQAMAPSRPQQPKLFCRKCSNALEQCIPQGEHEWRNVCPKCGYIDYVNPKLVVGCIVEHEGKVLLCKRGIEPCRHRWTVPAGFLELGEAAASGAARETFEEANARVTSLKPFSHLDIPLIGQAYLLFRAQLAAPYTHSPGQESLETQLFDPESDLPFNEIAFSSITVALQLYREDVKAKRSCMHYGVVNKQPGSHPADPSYHLSDHIRT